nr:pVII [Bat mastadenovirus BtSY2]
MAVVVSPSNNTGWGLGLRGLYGGAKQKSAQHPVYVSSHYRAGWGTLKRSARSGAKRRGGKRGRRARVPLDPVTAAQVEATIDEVARNGPPAARAAISAARTATRYNLRRNRRLTPFGRAMLQRGRFALMRTRSGRRVRVKRRRK